MDMMEVKASMILRSELIMDLKDHNWFGPPGAFVEREGTGLPNKWLLCCPGCGQLGSPKAGTSWTITSGSFSDVTQLTLRPSILKDCCGWHGWLNKGVFGLKPID